MTRMRLQKYLASAGKGSRRACEEMILEGRVAVDGSPVLELGTSVDPDVQKVTLDGNRVRPPGKAYYLINKPVGVVCSNRADRTGRPLLKDLIPAAGVRLFSVGRLDVDSKGAIILTNDGDFANRVSHPRYDVSKTYRVRVAGEVSEEMLEKLRSGVWLSEGKTSPAVVNVMRSSRQETLLRITLSEGKNRIIRRILARLRLKVTELERTHIGPIPLGRLKAGQYRKLNATEVKKLLVESGDTSTAMRRRDKPRREAQAPRRQKTSSQKSRSLKSRSQKPRKKGPAMKAGRRNPSRKDANPSRKGAKPPRKRR